MSPDQYLDHVGDRAVFPVCRLAYVRRMVNLTTLAPDIVAAILDETLPPEVPLFELAAGMPVGWREQREA